MFTATTTPTASVDATKTITQNNRLPYNYADATGLYHNGVRDNNPNFANAGGRYPEYDPTGLGGGINGYIYGLNNAYKFTDPWGLETGAVTLGLDPNNPGPVSPAELCFYEGIFKGVIGTAVVAAAAAGLATVGVPAAVITALLGTTAIVGTGVTGYDLGKAIQNGDWNSASYYSGSFVGGFGTGMATYGPVGNRITGEWPSSFRINHSNQNYNSAYGSAWDWLGTGPNTGSGALATGDTGSLATQGSNCECKK